MKRVINLIIFLISLSSVVSFASEDIILGDSLKKLDNYFETLQNELESKLKEESCFYCKTDQETIITYQKKQFSYFIQSFPKPIAYEIEKALEEGKSLDEIKSLYHQEVGNYLKIYLDFNRELSLYIEKKIRKHGPMVHDQIDVKRYQHKAKALNLESQIVYDTLQDVTEVILKDAFQWILKHNHLSLKEILHKVDLRRKLYDGFTIQVIYIASKYFRSEGIYAKSFDEEKILTQLTDKAAFRGINAYQVRSLWELVKGFHLEALTFMIEREEEKLPKDQFISIEDFTNLPEREHLATKRDIPKIFRLLFVTPVVSEYQQVYFQYSWLGNIEDKEEKVKKLELKTSEELELIKSRLEKLSQAYPELIDLNTLYDQNQNIQDNAKLAFDRWLKTVTPIKESAVDQIMKAQRILGEYIVGNYIGTLVGIPMDLVQRKKIGTNTRKFKQEFSDKMNNEFGYSLYGTKENPAGTWSIRLAPLLQLSAIIGGTLQLFEQGYEESMMYLYDLSEEEYQRALQGDTSFRTAKNIFYFAQGVAGLALTISTGGTSLVGAGAAASTKTTLRYASLKLAAMNMLKPASKSVWKAQLKSTKRPLAMAFTLGGVFSLGQEIYNEGVEGDEFKLDRFLSHSAISASGTLLFMGGISTLARKMLSMNFTQNQVLLTTASIDVIESSGDYPQTFKMMNNSVETLEAGDQRNGLFKLAGSSIVFVGNLLDSGDSAYTLVGGPAIRKAIKEQYSSMLNWMKTKSSKNSISDNAKLAEKRVEMASYALGRALTASEAAFLRLTNDYNSEAIHEELSKAGFTKEEVLIVLEIL